MVEFWGVSGRGGGERGRGVRDRKSERGEGQLVGWQHMRWKYGILKVFRYIQNRRLHQGDRLLLG